VVAACFKLNYGSQISFRFCGSSIA